MEKVGIGVLGLAHGHTGIYCRVMRHFDDVELVACWDEDAERGREAAAAHSMAYCSRMDSLLQDASIDAVIIGTETNRHAEMVEAAAAAGKHILCQKPMATTLDDCDRIIQAVQRHGIKFSMAFQMRHDPANRKIAEILHAGTLGRIAMMRRRHAIPVLLNPEFVQGKTRWHVDPVANVGMFFDDASHPADWLYSIFGMPVSVVSEIDHVVTHTAPDDNGVAIYRFARGEMVVLLNSSTTVAAVNTTEIYGDEGTLVQDYGDAPSTGAPRPRQASSIRYMRTGDTAWTELHVRIPASQGDRIAAVPRPFIDYVRGLTDQTISAPEGRASVEMVLGAYRAAREGRRVQFPLT